MRSRPLGFLAFLAAGHAAAAGISPADLRAAKNAQVKCAKGETCSPAVGLVAFVNDAGPAQCTGFLVAPDLFATNAHCVPEDLRRAGASCAGRVWLHFAPAPGKETRLECAEVIRAEGPPETSERDANDGADYAFYRVARPSKRAPLVLSRGGFPDNESLVIEKVDPVFGSSVIRGVQRRARCSARAHTFIAPAFTGPADLNPTLFDCATREGNSGSPLRAADGTVRGIYQSYVETKAFPFSLNFKQIRIEGAAAVPPISWATNFAAVEIPLEILAKPFPGSGRPAAAPAPAPHAGETARLARIRAEILAGLPARLAAEPALGWFRWGVRENRFFRYDLVPECLTAAAPARGSAELSLAYLARTRVDRYTRFLGVTVSGGFGDPAPLLLDGARVAIGAENFTLAPCDRN